MPQRISQLINKSWKWLRHCAYCGASAPPIEWLCHSCLNRLQSYYLEPKNMLRLQSSFRHCRLIDWNDENNQFIRRIIQSLKGSRGSPLFATLAVEFFLRIQQISSVISDQPAVLIPCPSAPLLKTKSFFSINKPFNHGFFWTQCLSDKTGYPIYSILFYPALDTAQKKKDILLRKKRYFICNNLENLPNNHFIIFADDVVTSGATAHAAYKALGKPKPFMVWSIFWRKLKNA